jgi:hypothetical protein
MTTLTSPQPRTLRFPAITPSISILPDPPTGLKVLKRVGHSNLNAYADDESAFFYEAGLEIDADGAPHAYHPDGSSGLDYLGNAGRPGDWWALVTDNGKPNGTPIIQTPNDPAPGFYVSTTTLENANFSRKDPRRYVNAEAINFIVLPGSLNLGTKLGDFTVVIRPETQSLSYAVYADNGPTNKIGEGSIALANALGLPSSPKTGGVGHGIVYIVLRGSAQTFPLSQAEIDKTGSALFAIWGGLDRAKKSFPKINWG